MRMIKDNSYFLIRAPFSMILGLLLESSYPWVWVFVPFGASLKLYGIIVSLLLGLVYLGDTRQYVIYTDPAIFMEPTLQSGASDIFLEYNAPEKGLVVAYLSPIPELRVYELQSRVVAIEGEFVEVAPDPAEESGAVRVRVWPAGTVFPPGEDPPAPRDSFDALPSDRFERQIVPRRCVFIVNDRRNVPSRIEGMPTSDRVDSRFFGPITIESIQGVLDKPEVRGR